MNISLIFDAESDRARREAERYAAALPTDARLWIHARNGSAVSVRDAAAARAVSVVTRPEDSFRLAHLIVVFGKNPFDADAMRILTEQGIPVEVDRAKPTRGKAKRASRP